MYHFENNIRWTRGNNWKIKTLEVSLLASYTHYPQRQGSVWQHRCYEGIQKSAEINRRNWMCATMTLKGSHSAHFHVSLFILGIYQGSFAWLVAENNMSYTGPCCNHIGSSSVWNEQCDLPESPLSFSSDWLPLINRLRLIQSNTQRFDSKYKVENSLKSGHLASLFETLAIARVWHKFKKNKHITGLL